MAEYPINKGVGRQVEFKGLRAQYLFLFAGGLLAVFISRSRTLYGRCRSGGMPCRGRGAGRRACGADLPSEPQVRGLRTDEGSSPEGGIRDVSSPEKVWQEF